MSDSLPGREESLPPSEQEIRAFLHKDDALEPEHIIDPKVEEEVVKELTDPERWRRFHQAIQDASEGKDTISPEIRARLEKLWTDLDLKELKNLPEESQGQ